MPSPALLLSWSLLLVACSDGPLDPAPVSPVAAPPTAPDAGSAAPDAGSAAPAPAARGPGPLPEVDGDIARIDLNAPDVLPRPGSWPMSSSTLTRNTCTFDPRKTPDGSCTMGCGDATVTPVEPGVFTLDAPAIGYSGTCVLLDGGARFVCRGSTAIAGSVPTLEGTLTEAGVAEGSWTVSIPGGERGAACEMAGAFRAQMQAG